MEMFIIILKFIQCEEKRNNATENKFNHWETEEFIALKVSTVTVFPCAGKLYFALPSSFRIFILTDLLHLTCVIAKFLHQNSSGADGF